MLHTRLLPEQHRKAGQSLSIFPSKSQIGKINTKAQDDQGNEIKEAEN